MRRSFVPILVALAVLGGAFAVLWRRAAPHDEVAWERLKPGPPSFTRSETGEWVFDAGEASPLVIGEWEYSLVFHDVERRPLTPMARLRDWWERE